jgi:two-component system, sporulation sensor kinase B
MLVEKLLLDILFILTPIHIYYIFFENSKAVRNPVILSLFYGISSFLCLLFSFEDYKTFWDLRNIPLVFAILYGNPVTGGIVFMIILGTRLCMGGATMVSSLFNTLLVLLVPLLFIKTFPSMNKSQRMWAAFISCIWTESIQIFFSLKHLVITANLDGSSDNAIIYFIVYESIQMAAFLLVAFLHETIIEKMDFKLEFKRSEKLKLLGGLAGSVAHEIFNPFTVMKGYLQMMNKEESNCRGYTDHILREMGKVESIIHDYMHFTRPQFDNIEKVQIAASLLDCIKSASSLAQMSEVAVETSFASHPFIYADPKKVRQAFLNLIKNAIEATDAGGKVIIELKNHQKDIYVTIRDTGKGMTKEEIGRIGTLFYSTKVKGTGIGMTITLSIIEGMNGRLLYESSPNAGTAATVILPYKVEEDVPVKGAIQQHF